MDGIDTRADILIVTALKLELDAVLGACGAQRDDWEHLEANPYHYYLRTITNAQGRTIRLAAARALEMGEVSAAACATRLIHVLQPAALAMCGVCAGRRGDVQLGDVIVADRLFKFDGGASLTVPGSDGKSTTDVRVYGDVRTYNLPIAWRYYVEEFGTAWADGLAECPPTMEELEEWFLVELHRAGPSAHPGALTPPSAMRASWPHLIDRLRRMELIDGDGRTLTESGRSRASFLALRAQFRTAPWSSRKPRHHLGAIATSGRLQRDSSLFERLSMTLRKTLGVEMEGSALGAIAELAGINMIMAKGVMDFADPDKDDGFKQLAAQAAAEFLVRFLEQHAVPGRPERRSPTPPSVKPEVQDLERGTPPPVALQGAPPSPAKQAFAWYLVLDGQASSVYLAGMLQHHLSVNVAVEAIDGEPQAFTIRSERSAFNRMLSEFRRGNLSRLGSFRVLYLCRSEGHDPEDTQEGQFGRLPLRRHFRLSADIVGEDNGWFTVALLVSSNKSPDAFARVRFYLHKTFGKDPVEVKTRQGRARHRVESYGSFTVGAEVLDSEGQELTTLELDLANLENVPLAFIET